MVRESISETFIILKIKQDIYDTILTAWEKRDHYPILNGPKLGYRGLV